MAREYVGKIKDFKGSGKRLIKEFKPFLWRIILVTILITMSSVIFVLVPLFLKVITGAAETDIANIGAGTYTGNAFLLYDGATISLNFSFMWLWFGLIIGFYVISSIFMFLSDWIIVKIAAVYAKNLRSQIKDKLDRMPLSYFDSHLVGDILSRGTNDVDQISRSMQQIINQTISAITLMIAVIVGMFIVSWELTLVTLTILPLTIGTSLLIMKLSQKRFVAYRKKLGDLNGIIEESYSGYRIIKLYNMEKRMGEQFGRVNEDLAKADRWSQWLSSFIFPSMRFITNLVFVGICLVAGVMTKSGEQGYISSMAVFFMFNNMFQQPFQQIGQITNQIQATVAAAERIFILLDGVEEDADAPEAINDLRQIHGEFDIEKVSFSYDKEKPLITDMNLKVNKGDSIAIVGPTGAGKTTIVNLLMRFYEIDDGQIRLDGRNVREYTRRALRDSVGMVLQDTWLFSGTIRENIRYGNSNASDEDIEKACEAASAHHFIKTLPNGYDFKLAEDGSNISQGQRQLLTIARALVSEPKIIILDEATSSVDTRTELAVQDAMNAMMKDKTSFVIAHRLSTIKNAKTILVMNKGQIVEKGNHKELLKLNGFYAELYNAQFSGTNPLAPKDPVEESNT